jgi:hypothetical protein
MFYSLHEKIATNATLSHERDEAKLNGSTAKFQHCTVNVGGPFGFSPHHLKNI